ncbi:hypothetical protein A1F94_010060 [Pyrenophora tritici-repentis]|uniref:Uncharacterized protein n=1 Tax=Pyrenophora tritici-repentis TaxID=45151 RepID=A0A2W1H0Y4_9PLEO|nr:hypothetical protein PtrV1_10854 [Pyrenophora tritici-repentis]KAF7443967.1 hypothetical protein A1F99_120410 [Pyrenophora tritici-repentis]KAF7566312.1 hypothetical protein PtrM4_146320 [Pyrenophora tritici-repentis]KAG9379704.1 hypothetical protein A1F94_010060 [Pyrenophora tritici-repentis]KAI0576310.1 hypothetical protein Alg215_07543 [Pyrenophora tritici-repentis]
MVWSRSSDGVVEFSNTAVKDHFEAQQDPQKRRHRIEADGDYILKTRACHLVLDIGDDNLGVRATL